jgi:hypothetical protein
MWLVPGSRLEPECGSLEPVADCGRDEVVIDHQRGGITTDEVARPGPPGRQRVHHHLRQFVGRLLEPLGEAQERPQPGVGAGVLGVRELVGLDPEPLW